MTNDTFLDQAYLNDDPDEDFNDGLDDLLLDDRVANDDLDDSTFPRRNVPPYSSYGPYHGPYNNPYSGDTKPEPSITKDLLKALLASHAREIALLKKINKDLVAPSTQAKN